MLQLLLPFQILFIPGLILLLLWCIYRVIAKKDRAVGLVLYISLVIIVDGFLNTGLYIPGLEQGSIRYSEICAFFLFLSGTAKELPEHNDRTIIILLAFFYFLLMFVSGLRGYTVKDGIFEFRKIMLPQIISFVLAYKGFKGRDDYKRFLFFLGALLIIIGLVTFWDVFFDRSLLKSDMLYKPEYWNNRRAGRFGSFFLNPNLMGAFAVLVFPVMFIRTFIEEITWKRIYCAVGLLALSFALIETQSRGPLLGVIISLFFLFAIPTRTLSMAKKIGYWMLFLTVFYLFMPGFFEHVTERFEKVKPETNIEAVSREVMWSFTQRIISDYPLAGIGFGEKQYIEYALRYGFKEEYSSMPLDNPHNSYLEMAVFAGIPALFIFILFNILMVKKGIGVILMHKGDELSLYLAGLLAGILGFLASAYVDMHMFTATVAPVYWLTCGLAYSMMSSAKRFENI